MASAFSTQALTAVSGYGFMDSLMDQRSIQSSPLILEHSITAAQKGVAAARPKRFELPTF